MAELQLKKTEYIPFLDCSESGATSPDWGRIDKSTIFALAYNPQSESKEYISTELPVEEISKYLPELPQEIALYEGNKVYDKIFKFAYDLPTGNNCIIPALLCFGGTAKQAWLCNATVLLGELNTVDGKITFTLKFGGNIKRGTFTITDGKPVFTESTTEI